MGCSLNDQLPDLAPTHSGNFQISAVAADEDNIAHMNEGNAIMVKTQGVEWKMDSHFFKGMWQILLGDKNEPPFVSGKELVFH